MNGAARIYQHLISQPWWANKPGIATDAAAMKAFPQALINAAEVYYWPVEKRQRNQSGRPAKLHAKLAIVDNTALVSSANLTADAFSRNLEVGVKVTNSEFLRSAKSYFEFLIFDGTLCKVV